MKKIEQPDGWCAKVFGNQWDIKDMKYDDELLGRSSYQGYEPVCLISPDQKAQYLALMEWASDIRKGCDELREAGIKDEIILDMHNTMVALDSILKMDKEG